MMNCPIKQHHYMHGKQDERTCLLEQGSFCRSTACPIRFLLDTMYAFLKSTVKLFIMKKMNALLNPDFSTLFEH